MATALTGRTGHSKRVEKSAVHKSRSVTVPLKLVAEATWLPTLVAEPERDRPGSGSRTFWVPWTTSCGCWRPSTPWTSPSPQLYKLFGQCLDFSFLVVFYVDTLRHFETFDDDDLVCEGHRSDLGW